MNAFDASKDTLLDTAYCVKCERWKALQDFQKDTRYKSGVNSWCKRCNLDRKIEYRKTHPKIQRRKDIIDGKNCCAKCHIWKPISEFSKSKKAKNGLYPYCHPCDNEKKRAWIVKNKDRHREIQIRSAENRRTQQKSRALQKAYGITLDQYNILLQSQNGRCAICGSVESDCGRQLCVDHDHATKMVRGLLCGNCNRAIGYLKDSIERAIAVAEYLKKHQR